MEKLFHTLYTEYSMRICSKQETTYLKVYRNMNEFDLSRDQIL